MDPAGVGEADACSSAPVLQLKQHSAMYWSSLEYKKRTGYQHTVAGDLLVCSVLPGKNSVTAGMCSACLWLWCGQVECTLHVHFSCCSSINVFYSLLALHHADLGPLSDHVSSFQKLWGCLLSWHIHIHTFF